MKRLSNLRELRLTLLLAFFCAFSGCASWKYPPPTPPGLADSDETLKQQLRPAQKEKTRSWWDISTYLDERTQAIEKNLGY